jgi:enterochelin esterase-like enzyme
VEVPAESPALWEARDVPHGGVEINWQKSAVLNGETRWIWVYTPPGYEKDSKQRYPVLYLFHGSNDTAGGWTLAGHANFILDNLLAEKKAVPDDHRDAVRPRGALRGARAGEQHGPLRTICAEGRHAAGGIQVPGSAPGVRTAPSPGFRWAAGRASPSASATWTCSAPSAHSARPSRAISRRSSRRESPIAKDVNAKLKVLWFACGKQDSLFERSQKFSDLLDAHQIKHTFRPSEGAHVFKVWRLYLSEFAPLLFR